MVALVQYLQGVAAIVPFFVHCTNPITHICLKAYSLMSSLIYVSGDRIPFGNLVAKYFYTPVVMFMMPAPVQLAVQATDALGVVVPPLRYISGLVRQVVSVSVIAYHFWFKQTNVFMIGAFGALKLMSALGITVATNLELALYVACFIPYSAYYTGMLVPIACIGACAYLVRL